MKIHLFAFVLFGVLLLAGCGDSGQGATAGVSGSSIEPPPPSHLPLMPVPPSLPGAGVRFSEYADADNGFSISYPENWQTETLNPQVAVSFLSPSQNADDVFLEHFSVNVQDLSGYDYTLEEFVDLVEQDSEKLLPEYSMLGKSMTEVGGNPAYQLKTSYKQGEFEVVSLQTIVFHDNKSFSLVYVAEAGQFDSYSAVATQMIESFAFI